MSERPAPYRSRASEPLPPHDIAAEEAVLGSILIDPECFAAARQYCAPEDFFHTANRVIFEAMAGLVERGCPPLPVSVAHELGWGRQLEEVGGATYLSQIIASTPTSVHAGHYAGLVHRLAMFRRLIQAGGQIAALGFAEGFDFPATLEKAEAILQQLRGAERAKGGFHGPVL